MSTVSKILVIAALAASIAACNKKGDENVSESRIGANPVAEKGNAASDRKGAQQSSPQRYSIDDGIDVCFKAIGAKIGADAKVSSITSFFSSGSEIDASAREPKGTLITCTVEYQNPADPRKLLSMSMDTSTGEFREPAQLEITVTGDAASFKLDDYLIPLSSVDLGLLKTFMDSQDKALGDAYSAYAWQGIRLEEPGAFSDKHQMRVDVEGRLKSNDIKSNGYASLEMDGKVDRNFLLN